MTWSLLKERAKVCNEHLDDAVKLRSERRVAVAGQPTKEEAAELQLAQMHPHVAWHMLHERSQEIRERWPQLFCIRVCITECITEQSFSRTERQLQHALTCKHVGSP